MTNRERFLKTLKCEPIGGQVPTFELVFFLTMEAFGKVHPHQRSYSQWKQMSPRERELQINDMADLYYRNSPPLRPQRHSAAPESLQCGRHSAPAGGGTRENRPGILLAH